MPASCLEIEYVKSPTIREPRSWRSSRSHVQARIREHVREDWSLDATQIPISDDFINVQIHSSENAQEEISKRFDALARTWRRETEKYSNLTKIVTHPAYQQIIALGPIVIPHILKSLQRQTDHWFWALKSLAQGFDAAEGEEAMEKAALAWINWGKTIGLLDK
jgi:hypothetical protein